MTDNSLCAEGASQSSLGLLSNEYMDGPQETQYLSIIVTQVVDLSFLVDHGLNNIR